MRFRPLLFKAAWTLTGAALSWLFLCLYTAKQAQACPLQQSPSLFLFVFKRFCIEGEHRFFKNVLLFLWLRVKLLACWFGLGGREDYFGFGLDLVEALHCSFGRIRRSIGENFGAVAGGGADLVEILIAPHWLVVVAEWKDRLVRSLHYYFKEYSLLIHTHKLPKHSHHIISWTSPWFLSSCIWRWPCSKYWVLLHQQSQWCSFWPGLLLCVWAIPALFGRPIHCVCCSRWSYALKLHRCGAVVHLSSGYAAI